MGELSHLYLSLTCSLTAIKNFNCLLFIWLNCLNIVIYSYVSWLSNHLWHMQRNSKGHAASPGGLDISVCVVRKGDGLLSKRQCSSCLRSNAACRNDNEIHLRACHLLLTLVFPSAALEFVKCITCHLSKKQQQTSTFSFSDLHHNHQMNWPHFIFSSHDV